MTKQRAGKGRFLNTYQIEHLLRCMCAWKGENFEDTFPSTNIHLFEKAYTDQKFVSAIQKNKAQEWLKDIKSNIPDFINDAVNVTLSMSQREDFQNSKMVCFNYIDEKLFHTLQKKFLDAYRNILTDLKKDETSGVNNENFQEFKNDFEDRVKLKMEDVKKYREEYEQEIVKEKSLQNIMKTMFSDGTVYDLFGGQLKEGLKEFWEFRASQDDRDRDLSKLNVLLNHENFNICFEIEWTVDPRITADVKSVLTLKTSEVINYKIKCIHFILTKRLNLKTDVKEPPSTKQGTVKGVPTATVTSESNISSKSAGLRVGRGYF